MNEQLYVKPNVRLEPMFNRWYAWANLIPPSTAAMYVANHHLPLMRSYVANPKVHAAAVKNPAMRGGPFIDHGGQRVNEVQELVQETVAHCGPMLEFAESVKFLDEMLRNEARGGSLEPLYARVPENLRGYVELVYDLNNNPSIRFLESLLYRSGFYLPKCQSLALSLIEQDYRPFVLSTPILPSEDRLHLPLTFEDEAVDEFARMKERPMPSSYLNELLNVNGRDEELLSSFLTTEAPPPPQRYEGDAVRIRYFGHACILIEAAGVSILTDPAISYKYPSDTSRYTYQDLPPEIDYVLISHNHQDHVLFETLLQIRHKVRNLVVPRGGNGALQDPSLNLLLRHTGFRNIVELDELDSIPIPGGEIVGLPFFGEHADLDVRTKIAHLVRVKGRSILCAADSCNVEPLLYERVHELYGDVDVLFLGMECSGAPLTWLYGPYLTKPLDRKHDQARRLAGSNYERSIDLARRLNCEQIYVYAMGQEPWLTYISSLQYTEESYAIVESNKLIQDCREHGRVSERLYAEKELFLKRREIFL
ncbi:MAG: MBL fold metallo-hydrolase [Bryobacteraceae bacterium]|jgi:L-ascorbate metabolism protein UlaG (beta-lactamase superfamily)